MKKSFLTIAMVLLVPLHVFSQINTFDEFLSDSLDSYISNGMKEWRIPGLSIAIVKDGKVIFNKGFGTKKVGTNSPVDSTSLFMIGSLSKALTAVTVVAVSEKDSISLEDPIHKWIPNLKFKNLSNPSHILIEDILTGRTGLGGHRGDFLFWKTNLNNSDLLRIMPHIAMESEVRRKFIYNNISYLLLDTILENSTTKNWATQISVEIFRPLKMFDSYAYASLVPESKKFKLATPHMYLASKVIPITDENIENMGPAGSIVSSSTDMGKWILEFINMNGILPTSVKKIVRKPYQLRGYRFRKDTPEQLRFLFSGMGWNIFDEFDKLTYTHDGGTDGFKSYLMIIPEERYGVIILTNSRSHDFTTAVVDELHYALMGKEFQHFSKNNLIEYRADEMEEERVFNEQKDLIKSNSSEVSNPNKFVGTYFNELYGNMSIVALDGQLKLILSQHQNNLKGKLDYIGNGHFWITFSSPEFSPVKIEFSEKDNDIDGFHYLAETSGDSNYWFKKSI